MSEELVKALLTEEVFAHIAEQHGRKGLRDKFMEILGAIRQWLRDKGLFELASLGESDLVFMLSKARESMRTGETSVMRGPTVIGDEVVAASGRPLPAGDPDYDAAMRLADVLGLRTQPSTTVFSIRGDAAPIDRGNQRTALFSALAKFEDAFQQPTPKGDTLEVIAREIDPAYKVKRMPASLAREKTRGQAVKMWEIGTPRSTYRVGYVYEDDRGRVWIDVSRLVADEDSGTKFYGIVSGYARNTRKVFIGDPAGLSPVALFRRLENMISSALRYGSTDHLYPHGAQIDPEAYFEAEGYPDFAREVRGLGIDWREGDYSHNLTEMLKASYNAAVRFAPQIKDVVYDFDRQQFVDADSGERRDRRSFRDYVGRNGAEAPSRYRGGSATLARAALVNTLLRGQGKEAWSQVLDHVGAQLRGRGLDHELSEIFYQRTDAPVREGLTRDQFRAALVGRFGEVGVASLEAQGLLNIVEGSDSKNAAWYEPTTGTAYFVPERLATAEQAIAAVLHEVGEHHGLEAMLGSRGWRALKGRIAQLARGKNEVRAAWDGVLDLYPEFSDIAQLSPSEAIQNDRFVHEVIAKIGETAAGRKSGLWRDILAAINRFLLKAGLGRQINKNELADLVAGSLARVIRGDGPEPGPGGGDRMDQRQFELKDYLPGGARWSEPASGPYREQNRRIREEHITAWEKAKKWLKRQFTPGGLLPDSVFAEKIRRDSEFEVIEFDVRNLVGSLERAIKQDYGLEAVKVSEETQRLMSEMMAGRVDAGVPAATMDALLGMRQYIDKLSVEYLDILGQQISELAARAEAAKTNGEGDRIRAEALERIALYETIMGNVGEYVHRSYRAFDDPEWARNVPDAVLDAAREYLTARMAEDSETKAEDIPERVETILNQILKHGTAYESLEGFIKESKLGAKDLSVLKRRKQIAPEIRALLGEYPDPRIGFSKSATKMGRLIWNSRFLDRVREVGLGEFMWEEGKQPPEATTKMAADGSEVYAPLNGLWTTPEVAQAFKDALGKEQMADWYRTIVKINGMVKYGKTVLSPTTAARNWMSAFFFSIANGHFDMRHMAKSVEGLREYFTHAGEPEKLAYLRELKQLGVVYDTPYAGEMMRLLQDTNISETLAAGGGKRLGIKKALEMATKFYQYGDDFWKIIGFENEKQNWIKAGFSQQEAKERAAERVRNTYPTYSMVGRIIQSLRRFPLAGTFVSFPAEIIRTSTNMVKYIHEDWKDPRTRPMAVRRALGMAFVSGMAYGLQHLSMLMLGFDDDDDEAVRQMAAPWQKNSSFIFLGRDENGNLRYLDISFLDPYNYWKRPIMAVMRDQPVKDKVIDSIGEVTMPFLGADIAASSIFQVMANKRDTGSPVYREHDDTLDQALDIANHLRKALQPGLAANIERTWKAMSNEVTPSGRRYSIEDELAAWVGFRVSTLDPKVALYYRSFEFMDAKSQAERKLRDVIRDPGEVSIDELAGARDTTLRMRQHAFEQMHTLVQAARRSGLTNSDIVGSLRNAGVSAADAGMIVRGRVTPWSPNSSTVRQTANKARNTFGPEAGGRVMDRYRALAGMN